MTSIYIRNAYQAVVDSKKQQAYHQDLLSTDVFSDFNTAAEQAMGLGSLSSQSDRHPTVSRADVYLRNPLPLGTPQLAYDGLTLSNAIGDSDLIRKLMVRYEKSVKACFAWRSRYAHIYASMDEMNQFEPEGYQDLLLSASDAMTDPEFLEIAMKRGYDGAVIIGLSRSRKVVTQYIAFGNSERLTFERINLDEPKPYQSKETTFDVVGVWS